MTEPTAKRSRGRLRLTDPQRQALLAFEADGTVNEGLVCEQFWILRGTERGVRRVMNSLLAKGLVERGCWYDEAAGFEYTLTAEGRRHAR